MINLEDEKIKFEFSALLENIIRSVIDGLRHETFEIPNLHEKADEAIAQTLEARIRDYQITNSRIDIPDGDVEQLLLSAEDECIDITMDAKYEEYLLSTEKRPLGTAGLLADELCKNLGNVVTRFEYEIDGDGFSCATCLIEDSHGGQTVFQSPKIRIRMQNLDFPIFGISFDDILKEKLRSNVLRVVYKHLKLDLPLC